MPSQARAAWLTRPPYVSGSPDLRAMNFGAAVSAELTAPSAAALDTLTKATIILLVRPRSFVTNRRIFEKAVNLVGGFHVGLTNTNGFQLRWWRSSANTSYYYDNSVWVNEWQWVIAAGDSALGAGLKWRLYAGRFDQLVRERARTSTTEGSGTVGSTAGTSLRIGNSSTSPSLLAFPGDIALAAIYGENFSIADAHEFQKNPAPGMIAGAPCLGYWRPGHHGFTVFDESAQRAGACGVVGAVPTSAGVSNFWPLSRTIAPAVVASNITGSLAGTLPKLTGALTGAVLVRGTLAGTLPKLTGSLTGSLRVSGTLSGTLPKLTASLSGTVGTLVTTGALAGTLPKLTGALTGQLAVRGTLGGSLPKLTGALTGQLAVRGTLGGSLPKLTGALAGQLAVRGTLGGSLPKLTASLAGALQVKGTLAGTLPKLTAALGGTVGTLVTTGVLSGTLPKLRASLTGALRVAGTLGGTLPKLRASFVGGGASSALAIFVRASCEPEVQVVAGVMFEVDVLASAGPETSVVADAGA